MKAAPVMRALGKWADVRQTLVHTGQHYDKNLSDVFFSQLNIPLPDANLEVGSGSHAWQTAEVMTRFEPVVLERRPDVVVVYGDVNSTVAAALVCSKLLIRVAHVEAGLRSFDRTMPEEINRIITDRVADMLFTPSEDADINLQREGIPADKIYRVGNVMIDSLVRLLPVAMQYPRNGLSERYALVTLHRPSNVDDSASLRSIHQIASRSERAIGSSCFRFIHAPASGSNNSVSTSKSFISWNRYLTSNSCHCRTALQWLLPTQVVFRRKQLT